MTQRDAIAEYASWCEAAGLPVRTMDPMDCYLAAGRILTATATRRGFSGNSDVVATLKSMTPAELAKLREDIKPRFRKT